MLVARQPLQPLPISTSQMSHRRISARLQQRDDDPVQTDRVQVNGKPKPSKSATESRQQGSKAQNEKKRKMSELHIDDVRGWC